LPASNASREAAAGCFILLALAQRASAGVVVYPGEERLPLVKDTEAISVGRSDGIIARELGGE